MDHRGETLAKFSGEGLDISTRLREEMQDSRQKQKRGKFMGRKARARILCPGGRDKTRVPNLRNIRKEGPLFTS